MDNIELIAKYLTLQIGNVYGAMGIIGNIFCECGLKSNNLENRCEQLCGITDQEYTDKVNSGEYTKDQFTNDYFGYGLCQWTYKTRKLDLYNFCIDWCTKNCIPFDISNVYMQLDFIMHELQTTKRNVYKILLGAFEDKIPDDDKILICSNFFCVEYERPAGYNTQDTQYKRVSSALNIYNEIFNKKHTGWYKYKHNTWFYLQDGFVLADKWLQLENKWYHFDVDGLLDTNKFLMYDGKEYYVGSDGCMLNDTYRIISGKKYKFDKEGLFTIY